MNTEKMSFVSGVLDDLGFTGSERIVKREEALDVIHKLLDDGVIHGQKREAVGIMKGALIVAGGIYVGNVVTIKLAEHFEKSEKHKKDES